uniref:Uncharacterized protein n=1 Tax=Kalanchoe fedtschenkoi TaxID=63787 RepID=A0A7N0REX5_KALFE
MGNCQAVDAASLVIQHPTGKSEKLFWPVPASQIMKSNPGHYVALIITTTITTAAAAVPGGGAEKSTLRITRVKLLRPTDALTLGHVYRLISTQEVMKELVEKKQAKMMKMKQAERGMAEKSFERASKQRVEAQQLSTSSSNMAEAGINSSPASAHPEKSNQMSKHETQRQRPTPSSSASGSKAWHPSLKSISESRS